MPVQEQQTGRDTRQTIAASAAARLPADNRAAGRSAYAPATGTRNSALWRVSIASPTHAHPADEWPRPLGFAERLEPLNRQRDEEQREVVGVESERLAEYIRGDHEQQRQRQRQVPAQAGGARAAGGTPPAPVDRRSAPAATGASTAVADHLAGVSQQQVEQRRLRRGIAVQVRERKLVRELRIVG